MTGEAFDSSRSIAARPNPGGTRRAAEDYGSRGWRVLPIWAPEKDGCTCEKAFKKGKCSDAGKHPRTKRGVHDATANKTKLSRWKWETANIGIATGTESDLLVIDIDFRNGGQETYKRLCEEFGELPPTPTVTTGDGLHFYFRHLSKE